MLTDGLLILGFHFAMAASRRDALSRLHKASQVGTKNVCVEEANSGQ